MISIDLNSDVGESYGNFAVGNDKALMPLLSSCNIACGFHGGDPLTIERTIGLALENQVHIGAHPSYPDLQGFGRRKMEMTDAEMSASLKYQIAVLLKLTELQGGKVYHVKPHGALYNAAAKDAHLSDLIIRTIQSFGTDIYFMGLAGSIMQERAVAAGIPFIAEAFADRKYTESGQLQSRKIEGSVITDPELALQQVEEIALNQRVLFSQKSSMPLEAQSFCIHGDNPSALAIAKRIREGLKSKSVQVQAFTK